MTRDEFNLAMDGAEYANEVLEWRLTNALCDRDDALATVKELREALKLAVHAIEACTFDEWGHRTFGLVGGSRVIDRDSWKKLQQITKDT